MAKISLQKCQRYSEDAERIGRKMTSLSRFAVAAAPRSSPGGRGRAAGLAVLAAAAAALAAIPLPALAAADGAAAARARLESEVQSAVMGLGDSSWEKREEAARSVLAMGSAAVPALCRALSSADAHIRFSAARIILAMDPSDFLLARLFGADQPYPALWMAIVRSGKKRLSAGARSRVTERLGYFGGREAAGVLADLVASGNEGDDLAAFALSCVADRDAAAEAAISAFGQAGPRAKLNLLRALGGICSGKAAAFLRTAQSDGDRAVASAAREASGKIGLRFAAREAALLVRRIAPIQVPDPMRRPDDIGYFMQFASDLAAAESPEEMGRVLAFLRRISLWGSVNTGLFTRPGSERWIEPLTRAYSSSAGLREKRWILEVMTGHADRPDAQALLVSAILDPLLSEQARLYADGLCEIMSPELGCKAMESREPWRRLILGLLSRSGSRFSAREIGRVMMATGASYAPDMLAAMGPEHSLAPLKEGLGSPELARRCADILGSMGERAGFDTLKGAMDRGLLSPAVLEGLGRTGDDRALGILASYIESRKFSDAALKGLVHLGDRRTLSLFISLLPDPRRAATALEGIEAVGDPSALPAVAGFIRNYRFLDTARDRKLLVLARRVLDSLSNG